MSFFKTHIKKRIKNISSISKSSIFCFDVEKYVPTDFDSWKKSYTAWRQSEINDYKNRSLSLLKKMNAPHEGTMIYRNKPKAVIEVKNLDKWFFNKFSKDFQQILMNINFEICEGEFVVILGESGSGKTTLLQILSGMDRPSNGSVIVANHNLISMNEKQLTEFRRKYVSIIFQNYALTTELTIKENVLFGYQMQENVRKRIEPDKLLEELSISAQKNKLPKQLSGGQQQRVAIAKAIAKNPKILFADEPTGAVDEKTCIDILKIFKDINQKYNTAIVLITHNRILAEIANKVIEISKGKIVDFYIQVPKKIEEINWKNKK